MNGRLAWLLAVACGSAALACAWDYDTVKMERARFPAAAELISGKFLRHSRDFYCWRIADRLQRMEFAPNDLSLLDDVGVAFDKLGQHALAVAAAERSEALAPGRYESVANRGTFLLHGGRTKDGIAEIRRALEINPNAHFGRERWQLYLAEYVASRREAGRVGLPLGSVRIKEDSSRDTPEAQRTIIAEFADTFPAFVRTRLGVERLEPALAAEAVQGVLGMMKFGNHESPILLEALGTLLAFRDGGPPVRNEDAAQLSARAFLKASYGVPAGPARESYRAMARGALERSTEGAGARLARVEREFAAELAEATAWCDELFALERSWIAAGKNADAEFDKLYGRAPALREPPEEPRTPSAEPPSRFPLAAGEGEALACLGAIAAGLAIRRWRFASRAPASGPNVA